ncbi:thyrotropin-releasing hormone receptor-like, partial [Physella acuta]|uniref:thyrotropin-releasing hormone receptor-like n=1 Tax=Physella acuta TaxID=109671 RepID=UPI0027DAD6B7
LVGSMFYAYFTPMVFVVGMVGNSLSLCVFLSKNMRHLSASTYLAALSFSDIINLIFYVLYEWLTRGLRVITSGSHVSFLHIDGACHVIMYLHYVSRFLSAWLVVAFTIERYIGVCHPLRRKHICTLSSTKRIVAGLLVLALLVNIFKPLLTVSHHVDMWGQACTTNPKYKQLSFILDSIYAVSITFVPFVIISVLNISIIRTLFLHNRQQRLIRTLMEKSAIKLEFTIILLIVSFCFVALNLPYFATWCKVFLSSNFVKLVSLQDLDEIIYFRGVTFIARAIFYINYCINFFLYSITGAYFRRELKRLFVPHAHDYHTCESPQDKKRFSTNSHNFRLLPSKTSDIGDSLKKISPPSTHDTWV